MRLNWITLKLFWLTLDKIRRKITHLASQRGKTYYQFIDHPIPVISVKRILFSADSAKPRSNSYLVSLPESKLPNQ